MLLQCSFPVVSVLCTVVNGCFVDFFVVRRCAVLCSIVQCFVCFFFGFCYVLLCNVVKCCFTVVAVLINFCLQCCKRLRVAV